MLLLVGSPSTAWAASGTDLAFGYRWYDDADGAGIPDGRPFHSSPDYWNPGMADSAVGPIPLELLGGAVRSAATTALDTPSTTTS